MSATLYKINERIKTAMKEGDTLTKDALKFLKGEMDRAREREFSDADISRLAKKLIEGYELTDTDKGEVNILKDYVLEQFTEETMKELVKSFINESEKEPKMGEIMGYFRVNYDGLFDGKALSVITKTILDDK